MYEQDDSVAKIITRDLEDERRLELNSKLHNELILRCLNISERARVRKCERSKLVSFCDISRATFIVSSSPDFNPIEIF